MTTDEMDDDGARWDAVADAAELILEGEQHEALHTLRDVVRTDPGNPYAFYYMGTALFELGRFDAAVDAYRAAVRLAPEYLAARVGLSHALRIAGDEVGALAQARRALEQSPGDGDGLFALGLAQASSGNVDGAITSLEAFLASGPELEISLEARAMLHKLQTLKTPPEDQD